MGKRTNAHPPSPLPPPCPPPVQYFCKYSFLQIFIRVCLCVHFVCMCVCTIFSNKIAKKKKQVAGVERECCVEDARLSCRT